MMIDLAAWRALGVDVAFDPADLPRRISEAGHARLAQDLASLDAARLLELYPRDPDGRLPLGEVVLLAAVELARPLPAPRQTWLTAESPARRSAAQVVTLALRDEIGRNFQHRWEEARWLWDRRAAGTPAEARWGVSGLVVEDLAPSRAAATLARLEARPPATPAERVTLAILLVRAGRWRDALLLFGVTHGLDPLPYERCNSGAGIAREKWDAALEAGMRAIAPWRFAAALDQIGSAPEGRLFTFPGQKTAKKHGVALESRAGVPHLAVCYTGSNSRLADLWFRWPPDLAQVVTGKTTAIVAVRREPASSTRTEEQLLAELAANPADDQARRVYADLLLERGDPRGELITLQLAERLDAAGKKRLRELERQWPSWLGPLARLVEQPRFERGFLARCCLGSARTPFDAWSIAGTPRGLAELAGVRELELADGFPEGIAAALLGKLPLLDTLVIGLPLIAMPLPGVRVLAVRVPDAAGARRALEALASHPPEELRLHAAAGIRQAEILRDALRSSLSHASSLKTIRVRHGRGEIAASRDRRGRMTVLDVTSTGPAEMNRLLYQTVPFATRECERGSITRIALHGPHAPLAVEHLRQVCVHLGEVELTFDDR